MWQVWDDTCPHRLAPLSEGRINEDGGTAMLTSWMIVCSLQWQLYPDSSSSSNMDKVWKSQRACASVYPSVLQDGIIWFWPDTRPEFKNIATSKGTPSIPVLSDPTFKDEYLRGIFHTGQAQ